MGQTKPLGVQPKVSRSTSFGLFQSGMCLTVSWDRYPLLQVSPVTVIGDCFVPGMTGRQLVSGWGGRQVWTTAMMNMAVNMRKNLSRAIKEKIE